MKRLLRITFTVLACWGCHRAPAPMQPIPPLTHTVRYSGETLSLISLWYTGSTSNWHEIAQSNPGLHPLLLKKGTVITIPARLAIRKDPFNGRYVAQAIGSAARPQSQNARLASSSDKIADGADQAHYAALQSGQQPNPNQAPSATAHLVSGPSVTDTTDRQYRRKREAVLEDLMQ